MSKEEFSREVMLELKDNLCRITGDGSLINLDMASEKDLKARANFLRSNERNPEYFNSALLIYFCNVVDGMVDAKYKDRTSLIFHVADHLLLAYTVYEDGQSAKDFLTKRTDELFERCPYLDRKYHPSDENMLKIRDDFARLKRVWYRKYILDKK